MPRRKIIDLPGALHFVTFSTYQRRRFLSAERPKWIVLEVLQQCLDAHQAKCSGFVVMPDHVHALLAVEENAMIGTFLQVWKKTSSYRIKQFYQQEFTRYQELCPPNCPIWQARYYDFNIDSDDKASEKIDYMHNNPVQAKLSHTPAEWPWSSARFYDLGQPGVVTTIGS